VGISNKRFASAVFLCAALIPIACSRSKTAGLPAKHYAMSGEVISLDAKDQTATIKAGAVSGWMEAMTMEFPIQSKSDFDALRVGEKIKATVDVKDEAEYSLSNVRPQNAAK
jgi:Cu/Ag efflux protein CusF